MYIPQRPAPIISTLALLGLLGASAPSWGHGSVPAIRGTLSTDSGPTALDVVISNTGSERQCEGNGAGLLNFCASFNTAAGNNGQIAVGDIDQDGWADVVVAGNADNQEQLCLNNQDGGFDCADFGTLDSSWGVALGDLNGDGTLDVVLANFDIDQGDQRCLNNGSGGFASCASFNAFDTSLAVALGDLDGDGDLDAALANNSAAYDRVCFNDGSGNFTQCSNFGTQDLSTAIALGDLDRDRDLDIVLVNNLEERYCLNDGSGGFTDCRTFNGSDSSRGLALGDLNGDAYLDVVIANIGNLESGNGRLCLNDGSGNFPSCADFNSANNRGYGVALGDLDGDGDLDAVIANGGTVSNEAEARCLNDGAGNLDSCVTFGNADTSISLALGQFDNDFFPDVTTSFVGGVTTSNFALTLASMVSGYQPAGLVAVYEFDAQYCNTGSDELSDLRTRTVRLSKGNALRFDDYSLPADKDKFLSAPEWREGGIGAELRVTSDGSDDYSDGVLASLECVTVHYRFNLFSLSKYKFAVRLFGASVTPGDVALSMMLQPGSSADIAASPALELDLGSLMETTPSTTTPPVTALPGGTAPTPVTPALSFPTGTSNLPSRR